MNPSDISAGINIINIWECGLDSLVLQTAVMDCMHDECNQIFTVVQ